MDHLVEFAEQLKEPIISYEEIEMIEGFFKDPKLSSSDAAKKAFKIYLQTRKQSLDPLLAKDVDSFLAKSEVLKATSHDSMKCSRTVCAPLKYRQSIVEFFLFANELERAIQDLAFRRKAGKPLTIRTWSRYFAQSKFYQELGAMRAEWQYIRSIPREVRMRMLSEIENDQTFEKEAREFFARSFRSADLSEETYIARQHQAGRFYQ